LTKLDSFVAMLPIVLTKEFRTNGATQNLMALPTKVAWMAVAIAALFSLPQTAQYTSG
jgi:hypothetical protein